MLTQQAWYTDADALEGAQMETCVAESCASRIRRGREALGISPAELSRRAGLSRSQISRIESGQMPHPPADTLAAIARVLGVSTDYLLNGPDCGEDELPPELQAMYRLLSPEERALIDELARQRTKLPDTPEGRAAFLEAIRVAMLYLRGKLADS